MLAEFTSSAKEKRRLLELCSAQGSDDYTQLIREPNVNVLDVLNAFPSCQPPIERLLEHWPRLLARPYSLSSSPLVVWKAELPVPKESFLTRSRFRIPIPPSFCSMWWSFLSVMDGRMRDEGLPQVAFSECLAPSMHHLVAMTSL